MFKFTVAFAVIFVSLVVAQLAVTDEPARDAVVEPVTHEEAHALAAKTPGFMNLQTLGLALHGYHDIFGKFPPAVLFGPDGKTTYSWRVELLPFLKELSGGINPNLLTDKTGREQYNQLIAACGYDLNQPWDSPQNQAVLKAMPQVYRHPGDKPDSLDAAFYAVVGAGSAFDPNDTARYFQGARDESEAADSAEPNDTDRENGIQGWPATTLMIVESRSREPWTKPIDLAYTVSSAVPRFGGFTNGGFLALSCDGAVHFVSDMVAPKDLRAFISKDSKDEFTVVGIPYRYK